jgi:hypothetical protein
VVTAFTIAHTLTLTLSVLNIVMLSSRVVEPMIAASIVFVAVQNIFWPRHARGWSRLAIAFAFGLFHGLGFAGGLKQAMSEMPVVALGVALAAFSIGVEIGHQLVVIPLFVLLKSKAQTRRARTTCPMDAFSNPARRQFLWRTGFLIQRSADRVAKRGVECLVRQSSSFWKIVIRSAPLPPVAGLLSLFSPLSRPPPAERADQAAVLRISNRPDPSWAMKVGSHDPARAASVPFSALSLLTPRPPPRRLEPLKMSHRGLASALAARESGGR